MRVLITGATGFIGRRLAETLCERGVEVRAVCRRAADNFVGNCPSGKVLPVVADLTLAPSLEGICTNVQAVFHLAGYAHTSGENNESAAFIHRKVTVDGTRLLLEQARMSRVKRFVFASSVKAMGEGGEKCLRETDAALPESEYGRAKLEAEQLVLAAGRRYGMHVCVLRLPIVYGPGLKGNLLSMIGAVDRGRFPPLPEVNNRRSMIHVDDVVQAVQLAVNDAKANGQIYLVTDGKIYSTYEIYVSIRRALGKEDPRWRIPQSVLRTVARIGDVIGGIRARPFFFNSKTLEKLLGSAWYSAEKIERDLGFKPERTFEAALPRMIEVYRKASSAECSKAI